MYVQNDDFIGVGKNLLKESEREKILFHVILEYSVKDAEMNILAKTTKKKKRCMEAESQTVFFFFSFSLILP